MKSRRWVEISASDTRTVSTRQSRHLDRIVFERPIKLNCFHTLLSEKE
jgi:hypothetical protein